MTTSGWFTGVAPAFTLRTSKFEVDRLQAQGHLHESTGFEILCGFQFGVVFCEGTPLKVVVKGIAPKVPFKG